MAGRSGDAEFLRRVSLDLAGTIPTVQEVRAFLADRTPQKRAAVIDRLLAGEAFAQHWAERLSVVLLERQNLGKVPPEDWHAWLQGRLKDQPRWDLLVREMIEATGRVRPGPP